MRNTKRKRLDEVITGFRLASGGASQYTGVHADLYTFGKIVAVYGGRRDIVSCVAPSQFETMFVSDTHTDELIAMTCDVITEVNT